jgi:dihydroorotase
MFTQRAQSALAQSSVLRASSKSSSTNSSRCRYTFYRNFESTKNKNGKNDDDDSSNKYSRNRSSVSAVSVRGSSERSSITIARPDDWHVHVRDGAKIASVIPFTAKEFGRALIMPNLQPPVRTSEEAKVYREMIIKAANNDMFEPHMTLYLTDETTEEVVERAASSGFVRGFKLYPAGATTNSSFGVTNMKKVLPALRAIAKYDLVLQVHGEVTHQNVDIFDREAKYIDEVLKPLLDEVPDLRVVMEHITTKNAADFVSTFEGSGVSGAKSRLAATITPQHMLLNRNSLFKGGIRPHLYCLPILKREEHREAVLAAAVGEQSKKFFLGTDSAPHPKGAKEAACGCAGVFSAHAALSFYAMAFDSVGKLDKLEEFASHNGADFYKLPRNTGTVTLKREEWEVPASYEFAGDVVVPFYAGEKIPWKFVSS